MSAHESADNVPAAAARVDYRLSYEPTASPRPCHGSGIDGPDLKNAYCGRDGYGESSELGSGDWVDPEHPDPSEPERAHIDRWFVTAICEAVHEAMEWFWVDGAIYLDPHGENENHIHSISRRLGEELLSLRDVAPEGSA